MTKAAITPASATVYDDCIDSCENVVLVESFGMEGGQPLYIRGDWRCIPSSIVQRSCVLRAALKCTANDFPRDIDAQVLTLLCQC